MTATKILKKAKSYIGTKDDGNNKVIFNTEYYGRAVSGDAYPWCVVFIWYLFNELGASKLFCGGKKVASCGVVMSEMSAQKLSYKTKPKKGDLAIYDFSGNHKEHTHIGIVSEVLSSTEFKAIEGNTSSTNYTNGGYVLEQKRNINQVNCFIRPKYSAEKEKTVALVENGAIYKYAYKDVIGKSSKNLKSLKKGKKVTPVDGTDDGFGWSKVKYGDITGWIMNKHLDIKGLSEFKKYTLKSDTTAMLVENKKLTDKVKLKKGTKYTLISEIEKGEYKGYCYFKTDGKHYYAKL
ncbi:MAG: CHAP domain-containing protein [Ruminococcus sp.]|nr:CHAP domain-containing protein [Ruminococcus sp.]